MLPYFPNFKPLEWCDRTHIENIIKYYPVYSDFNVTSLNIWNVQDEMQVCRLRENVVVRFSDYIDGKPFFSFYGMNNPADTANILLDFSLEKYRLPSLKLIPEIVAAAIPRSDFVITQDPDSFDYIYPVPFFASLSGQPAKCKPAIVLRSFLRAYDNYCVATQQLATADMGELREIFQKWACMKGVNHRDLHEYSAFDRLLNNCSDSILITTISILGATKGFIITEIPNAETAICHFYKADISIKGMYEALLSEACKMLNANGVQSLNFEQDLGIPNLRYAKGKYKEHTFLKKYTIEKRM